MSHFAVVWRPNSSPTVLGRITARDGSGAATGVAGEGNFLQQADVSTITCAIFDRSGTAPDVAISTPPVTISISVLDTVVTTDVIWTQDTTGYNFVHDLSNTTYPTPGSFYVAKYVVTLTGGTVFYKEYSGVAERETGG